MVRSAVFGWLLITLLLVQPVAAMRPQVEQPAAVASPTASATVARNVQPQQSPVARTSTAPSYGQDAGSPESVARGSWRYSHRHRCGNAWRLTFSPSPHRHCPRAVRRPRYGEPRSLLRRWSGTAPGLVCLPRAQPVHQTSAASSSTLWRRQLVGRASQRPHPSLSSMVLPRSLY